MPKLQQQIRFREVVPTDLPSCIELEHASYPEDEAASKTTLQYRQHQAAPYFCCAVIDGNSEMEDSGGETLIGFVCSTRCTDFTHESMTTHDAGGQLLAIHSVVVREDYRRQGIATYMLQEYIKHVSSFNQMQHDEGKRSSPIEKMVLLAKKHLLCFYINAGFRVVRESPIVHGSERWYELDREIDIPWNYPCWVVDAFADPKRRGTGNPAGVVLMPDDTDVENNETRAWMQTTAQQFNLAETAFVWRKLPAQNTEDQQEKSLSQNVKDDSSWHYNIRYFTPTVEVPLCGHASIASASILFQHQGLANSDSIVFHAAQDKLVATLAPSRPNHTIRGQRRVTMSFPSKPATELQAPEDKATVHSMLEEAFSIQKDAVLWMGLSDIGDLLVEISPSAFDALGYSGITFDALLGTNVYTRGVILCCSCPETSIDGSDNSKVDFRSRFFAPKAGILEDPVTGSAHCVLAPYFCAMLNKATVIGHQQSKRGGFVECTMPPKNGSDKRARVEIVGLAVTTMSGKVQ